MPHRGGLEAPNLPAFLEGAWATWRLGERHLVNESGHHAIRQAARALTETAFLPWASPFTLFPKPVTAQAVADCRVTTITRL